MRTWQILDVGSIWMKEFASALQQLDPVVAWSPQFSKTGMFERWQRREDVENPSLEVTRFPLQRGYARAPLRWMAPFENGLLKRLLAETPNPAASPLVCSTPFYAPVAERWLGPVIYYVTDLTVAYAGLDPAQVRALDQRMCRVAHAVCPNSERIAAYLTSDAGCDPRKITLIPNATRATNVLDRPRAEPGPLPGDVASLPRPIVGVLGELSLNLDWELIAGAMQRTPGVSWLFVGPTKRKIPDETQSAAREWARQHGTFVGMKPYGMLQDYARCVDVALLPYLKVEPTYSGSSTRFYEHLAAGRPMLATRGFAELLKKEPLLCLVDTVDELVAGISQLHAAGFRDGYETARWEASKLGTWEQRALTMRNIIAPPEHEASVPVPMQAATV
jgi:hypothetical protein